MGPIFVSGIDTDVGKTYATGLMARYLLKNSPSVITQKVVQTGCKEISDDILVHRQLMGCGLMAVDRSGMTCPYLFSHPSSPHLSAGLEGKRIDPELIRDATAALEKQFATVLIEGAGGLMVPLNSEMKMIDHIETCRYPVVLVSASRLGSINHTFLSIEALKSRGIRLLGIIYNTFPETDPFIAEDSRHQIQAFMVENHYPGILIEMGRVDVMDPLDLDFQPMFHPVPESPCL